MARPSERTVVVVLGVAALIAWCATPVSFWEIIREPWHVLRDSEAAIQSTVLDVSQDPEPLLNASRQVLKPFGALRLDRIFKTDTDDTRH